MACASASISKTPTDEMPVIVIVRAGTDPDKITCADPVLVRPFTARKLLNRIVRMLPDSVGEVLQVGDFTFNPDSRSLRVGKTRISSDAR